MGVRCFVMEGEGHGEMAQQEAQWWARTQMVRSHWQWALLTAAQGLEHRGVLPHGQLGQIRERKAAPLTQTSRRSRTGSGAKSHLLLAPTLPWLRRNSPLTTCTGTCSDFCGAAQGLCLWLLGVRLFQPFLCRATLCPSLSKVIHRASSRATSILLPAFRIIHRPGQSHPPHRSSSRSRAASLKRSQGFTDNIAAPR